MAAKRLRRVSSGDRESVTVRRATPADAPLLAEHRAAVWIETDTWTSAQLQPQLPVWRDFFERCMRDESYAAYIAENDGAVIGSGGLLVYLVVPRPGNGSDRAGRVQSVYVAPHARRRGVAREIVRHIITLAREKRLASLVLRPTEASRSLYAEFGFQAADELLLRPLGD
jgi:GNAT superfamily N-acetyltransferase